MWIVLVANCHIRQYASIEAASKSDTRARETFPTTWYPPNEEVCRNSLHSLLVLLRVHKLPPPLFALYEDTTRRSLLPSLSSSPSPAFDLVALDRIFPSIKSLSRCRGTLARSSWTSGGYGSHLTPVDGGGGGMELLLTIPADIFRLPSLSSAESDELSDEDEKLSSCLLALELLPRTFAPLLRSPSRCSPPPPPPLCFLLRFGSWSLELSESFSLEWRSRRRLLTFLLARWPFFFSSRLMIALSFLTRWDNTHVRSSGQGSARGGKLWYHSPPGICTGCSTGMIKPEAFRLVERQRG